MTEGFKTGIFIWAGLFSIWFVIIIVALFEISRHLKSIAKYLSDVKEILKK